jgi:hypothetical protein
MTKLIVVKKTSLTGDVAFSEVSVVVPQRESLAPGLNVLVLPFDVREASGNRPVKGFSFLLEEALADRGIMLAGAYQKEDCLKVLLYNLGSTTIGLNDGQAVIKAFAYDTIVLRQNTEAVPLSPVPKVAKKRRKATPP